MVFGFALPRHDDTSGIWNRAHHTLPKLGLAFYTEGTPCFVTPGSSSEFSYGTSPCWNGSLLDRAVVVLRFMDE